MSAIHCPACGIAGFGLPATDHQLLRAHAADPDVRDNWCFLHLEQALARILAVDLLTLEGRRFVAGLSRLKGVPA